MEAVDDVVDDDMMMRMKRMNCESKFVLEGDYILIPHVIFIVGISLSWMYPGPSSI
jgi:hypothetical protein